MENFVNIFHNLGETGGAVGVGFWGIAYILLPPSLRVGEGGQEANMCGGG